MGCNCRKSGGNRRLPSDDTLMGKPSPHVLIARDGTKTRFDTREEALRENAKTGYSGVVRRA